MLFLEYSRCTTTKKARKWLEETGFTVLQCADRLLMDSGVHGNTWFIAARRPCAL